ncbi:hypothetical protein HWV07_14595 [Natronomonas salina]|uniref:hypothetical protein n=1 Tax=Natronomonas salina TaxID=1710540 RepID=UPI0015B737AB|nr:hypothetical protein [Natronomonas salina]QLD90194.1 hypothetical protein HWV07_14595 [Natronomonas salina]
MERRVIAGAAATLLVVVAGAVANFATDGDLVVAVLLAGMAGGLVTGLLSRSGGHVGAGARAGAYGGGAGFALFLVVGSVQTVVGGDLSVLYIGVQSFLVAVLVVPLHALLGAGGAAMGVAIRRAAGRETGL